jgi:hypothetical protein
VLLVGGIFQGGVAFALHVLRVSKPMASNFRQEKKGREDRMLRIRRGHKDGEEQS